MPLYTRQYLVAIAEFEQNIAMLKKDCNDTKLDMFKEVSCLVQLSNLSGREREKVLPIYLKMHSLQFANDKYNYLYKTSVWRLFCMIFDEVIENEYQVEYVPEGQFLGSLLNLGDYCIKLKHLGIRCDKKDVFDNLWEFKEGNKNCINPKFKSLVEEVFQELDVCMDCLNTCD